MSDRRLRIRHLDDLSVPVISRKHLIQNKKALGRPQDKADIERLNADE